MLVEPEKKSGKKTGTLGIYRGKKPVPFEEYIPLLVRWLLQKALKFEPTFGPRSKLKRVPPTQKLKKISVS